MTQTNNSESLTQEIERKSCRMVNAFFDDWFEVCKWCKHVNHEHSISGLKHCWKMLEKRKKSQMGDKD